MHTSIMAKMTKELVLITDSRKHYEALLQQWFRHQDNLKWIWCNGMKWCTRWDEQFDILHARNGATDAEIRRDEHGMKYHRFGDLAENWTWHKQSYVGMFASSMHSPQGIAWQTKHSIIKKTCLLNKPSQEQVYSMQGSTTTSLAKLNNM